MLTATISETKTHLSSLLEKVQNGETLTILDRKRPIARVVRITDSPPSPHLTSPKSGMSAVQALELPIGGSHGKSSGVLSALLDERRSSL